MDTRLETTISHYEDLALELNDLRTAMRLNWLRNSVRFDGLDPEHGCYVLLHIVLTGKFDLAGKN